MAACVSHLPNLAAVVFLYGQCQTDKKELYLPFELQDRNQLWPRVKTFGY